MIQWKDLRYESKHYKSIMVCLIKGFNGTCDIVIAIVRGWIFDSNLLFVITLDEKHLYWCSGASKNELKFGCFSEMVKVCKG